MADQNSIPPNLPLEEKKSGSAPSVNPYPKPAEKPVTPPPLTSNSASPSSPEPESRPVKSYIRTMNSDIKSVQMGQAPRGAEQSLPVAVPPEASQPTGGQRMVSSQTAPKPTPVAEIKLSKPESGAALPSFPKEEVKIKVNAPHPLPQIFIPTLPSAPRPALPPIFSKPESHPVPSPAVSPRPILPPFPPSVRSGGPTLPVPNPKPETKPSIVPPPKSASVSALGLRGFIGPKMLIPGVVLLLLVAAGFGYWFFVLRGARTVIDGPPKATPSISATASVQPTLRVSKLSPLFSAYYLLPIKNGEGKTLTSVLPEIKRLNLTDPSKNILLNPRSEVAEDYTFSAFLDRFLIDFPANLLSAVDEKDFDLIWSTQKELFNVEGKEIPSNFSTAERRLALAVRVINAEQVRKTVLEWEATLADDWQNFFVFPAPTTQISFLPASYRDVAIRYLNFNYPDYSIDYAVVTANNNDDYLVISNSREQMFGIIDVLLGFGL